MKIQLQKNVRNVILNAEVATTKINAQHVLNQSETQLPVNVHLDTTTKMEFVKVLMKK